MNNTLTVIEKRNGDKAICIPVESFKNVTIVTLQKDGEIRWASSFDLQPGKVAMTPEATILFSEAVRLALYLWKQSTQDGYQSTLNDTIRWGNVGSGLTWETKKEGL